MSEYPTKSIFRDYNGNGLNNRRSSGFLRVMLLTELGMPDKEDEYDEDGC
jgi:hypothetical protein